MFSADTFVAPAKFARYTTLPAGGASWKLNEPSAVVVALDSATCAPPLTLSVVDLSPPAGEAPPESASVPCIVSVSSG